MAPFVNKTGFYKTVTITRLLLIVSYISIVCTYVLSKFFLIVSI